MNRKLMVTADGSHTIYLPDKQVSYHSMHGAIQESMHVFIESGFHFLPETKNTLRIFEMGFGTGLNALLTLMEAEKNKVPVTFHSIEAFPLEAPLCNALNFPEFLENTSLKKILDEMHNAPFATDIFFGTYFTLKKYLGKLETHEIAEKYDLIYFDAFSPEMQPEIWTEAIFKKLINMLHFGGCLVTYCSKSIVRQAMQAAGFTVTKIPGPWGKREMVRAIKLP